MSRPTTPSHASSAPRADASMSGSGNGQRTNTDAHKPPLVFCEERHRRKERAAQTERNHQDRQDSGQAGQAGCQHGGESRQAILQRHHKPILLSATNSRISGSRDPINHETRCGGCGQSGSHAPYDDRGTTGGPTDKARPSRTGRNPIFPSRRWPVCQPRRPPKSTPSPFSSFRFPPRWLVFASPCAPFLRSASPRIDVFIQQAAMAVFRRRGEDQGEHSSPWSSRFRTQRHYSGLSFGSGFTFD